MFVFSMRKVVMAQRFPGTPNPETSAAQNIFMTLLPVPLGSSGALVETMALLRRWLPWDAEQTHVSLIRYLVEETYEGC